MLHFDAVAEAPMTREPFPHFVASRVLDVPALDAVRQDFPPITKPGVFPLSELSPAGAFADLIEDINSAELESIMEEKFQMSLAEYPLMITVRGHCQKKDGRIHTDSLDKIVTCLLYLNPPWSQSGGRLRLLRNGTDLEDMVAEVPPNGGTLVAFQRTDNSWHGHHPYEGERRYVMFNWVKSDAALRRNLGRHKFSARLKRFKLFS